MIKKKIKSKFPSELRMDLVSNDWVVIATGRGRRPTNFAKKKSKKDTTPMSKCPFCQQENLKDIIAKRKYDNGSWFVISIPNKFPAFLKGDSLGQRKEGPNRAMNGFGYHEVIITADHKRSIAEFSLEEAMMLVDLYQARYLDLMNKKFIKYISIFHNHGEEAGASVAHPHSQLMAIPVIDPDLGASLDGAEAFYVSQGKCVYCTMIEWDIKDGRRIIYENEKFVVLCPFASQASFEVRVYPKEHQPCFEKITETEKKFFAEALQIALSKIRKGLNNPAYNFYIHTSPSSGGSCDFYHWHLNILPRTSTWAGFELGSGIEISTIEPEKAAEFLRKQ